mmetsp:Transcript_57083/g.113392  ORF Transcript_57083/g.113392 Transcript_57083/m.113392 type:complete len:82 (-) Transcript_57083:216-461(-)|eukprot:CAMPEP_0174741252 /NCGR_PEP_ID=MMETSP1094-20130205/75785_1 /TAXON_ID=156173 /ORGANISM="Chrysochromulina brevifilum, Strain UTEX LB 985" /LENGTH=81 /DNA_ID=CAMNT_0015945101 /DNA_START=167 /DNA_END=412 /DNA_ORIENTATION=+
MAATVDQRVFIVEAGVLCTCALGKCTMRCDDDVCAVAIRPHTLDPLMLFNPTHVSCRVMASEVCFERPRAEIGLRTQPPHS